jgi:hypothetical protein
MLVNETFKTLLREAEFTKDMLGSGATQIRAANYATKGVYFQAFTSLSTGLERIGKLCLMLDHYIDHRGSFPDLNYMKSEIGHKLLLIYERSKAVVTKRSISLRFAQDLSDPVHQSILKVLSDFAEGDRYSNINLLVGSHRKSDPIASWFKQVDEPLYKTRVTHRKKDRIRCSAAAAAAMMGSHSTVLHTSETGSEITDLEEASRRTGMQDAVAPYRQLYVLQVIRYWVEFLSSLQNPAMHLGKSEIPFFDEVFAPFSNSDSLFRGRKTWHNL